MCDSSGTTNSYHRTTATGRILFCAECGYSAPKQGESMRLPLHERKVERVNGCDCYLLKPKDAAECTHNRYEQELADATAALAQALAEGVGAVPYAALLRLQANIETLRASMETEAD